MQIRPALATVPRKTYATADKAVAAFEKACSGWDGEVMNYIVSTAPDGRFFIVALPSSGQIQVSISLAYAGFAAVRT